MSFWSSQTLLSRLPTLIDPFDVKSVESASYELHLGEEVYISALPDTPLKERVKINLKEQKTIPIPPGQFAFLITKEEVSIPEDVIAFISMKFGIKAKGLINVSGFHVDPGYSGRLIFAVYNAGPLIYHVEYGEPLFLIWFANLDNIDERPRRKKGFSNIPTEFMNTPDLVASLPYLVKRMDELDKKVDGYSIKQNFIWVICGSLVGFGVKTVFDFLSHYR